MKTIIKALIFFAVISASAQSNISLSLHQDARLLITGDNIGNNAGTLDLLLRFKMQGNQFKHGYIIVFPEFEYSEIDGNYKRYSANAGYTFNQFVKNFEFSATGGYGWIDRYGKTMFSFSGTGEIAYNLGFAKISAIGQLTERSDLAYYYGDKAIRFSGFIGIEINLK